MKKALIFLSLLVTLSALAFTPSSQQVTNYIASYGLGTNYNIVYASTNVTFTPQVYYLTNVIGGVTNIFTNTALYIGVTIPPNTNSLTPAQTNVLFNAVTNAAGGNFAFNSTNYARLLGNNPFANTNTFYATAGEFNLIADTIIAGANLGGGTSTANATKDFQIIYPGYNEAVATVPVLDIYSSSSTSIQLAIGGSGASGASGGSATDIYFQTMTNIGTSSQTWLHLDAFGNFNFGAGASVGTSTNKASNGFFLNLNSTISSTGNLIVTNAVSCAAITNGQMIIWGTTNTLPPVNTNYTYIATQTNAPGWLFVSSNGVWVRK